MLQLPFGRETGLRRRRTFVSRSIKRNRIRQNLCRAGSGLQTYLRFPGRFKIRPRAGLVGEGGRRFRSASAVRRHMGDLRERAKRQSPARHGIAGGFRAR